MISWKCILLDFDYTLVDSSDGICECFQYSFEALNLQRQPKERIKKTIGLSLTDSFLFLQGEKNQSFVDSFIKLFEKKPQKLW